VATNTQTVIIPTSLQLVLQRLLRICLCTGPLPEVVFLSVLLYLNLMYVHICNKLQCYSAKPFLISVLRAKDKAFDASKLHFDIEIYLEYYFGLNSISE
jgi:hypothetical protein